MPSHIGPFIIAFVITIVLTPIVRWLCVRFSLNAPPNPIIASHKTSTPTLGGVSVFIAFMVAIGIYFRMAEQSYYFLKLFFGVLPIFLMGIYDDLKSLTVKFKGLMEIILVIFFILFYRLRPDFNIFLPFDYFLMLLWFVGVINAFNLIDIMDGLASGIGLFASLGFFVMASHAGRPDLMIICSALAGCYLAFLYYNFNPAKIFLGDNGSLVMGLSLAYVGFELVGHEPLSPRAMAPVIILAIPIFEVFLLITRRLKKKIPILKGSPDHLGLVLQALGNSIPRSAIIVYVSSVILDILGIWVMTSGMAVQVGVSLFVILVGIILLSLMVRTEVLEKSKDV